MNLSAAFEVTEDDIATVLSQNADLVVNKGSKLFSEMAEQLHDNWLGGVLDRIALAALDGGTDLDDQTTAAHAEIRTILVEEGVLKH